MRITLLGSSGLRPKATVSQRALPIGRSLARRGHEVTLVVPPYDDPAAAGNDFIDAGVTVRQLPLEGGLAVLPLTAVSVVSATRPDVVHVFKPTGPSGAAALALGRRFPLVLDCDDWEGQGGWADNSQYSAWQSAVLDWQERTSPRAARRLTVASRALMDRLHDLGIPVPKMTYLPNCVDIDWADAAGAGQGTAPKDTDGGNSPVVLYIGYVPRINDLDLLAVALELLMEDGVDFKWRIVGDGPGLDELRRTLPETLRPKTDFLGRLSHDRLRDVLPESRLLCSPLRDTPIARCKCPMKVINAQAMGIPVVASDLGQHREYVADGVTGYLVDPADPRALSAKIGILLRDQTLAKQLGKNARQRMRSLYTWETWLDQVESAYVSAIAA